jgi:hypothetical protein
MNIRLIAILTTTACGGPEWSDERVFAPHVAVLDSNGDGRVTASEYDRTLWNGPPFATADQDHDGQLSPTELAWLTRHQSPTHFDGGGHGAVKSSEGPGRTRSTATQHRIETLVWLHTAANHAGRPALDPALLEAVQAATEPDAPALAAAEETLGLR